jgi:putative Ca2+/H+ antiporter (TMEM165/GDT1 family)
MQLTLFLSTFVLIFVAELPDKTAFAALFLATCHNPFAVFLGASLAFVIQSLVAVAFGSFLSMLPPQLVHIAAGFFFLVFAYLMWRRKQPEGEALESSIESKGYKFSKSLTTAFVTIFIAEWGDLTQLATATLEAKYHSPIIIFTSSTLALWCVTAIGVIIGSKAKDLINPIFLQKTAAGAFGIVGIGMLLKA